MTRTTDDLQEREQFKPLGSPIPRAKPAPEPEWRQKPGAAKGVQEDRNGRLRTNIPENDRCG